MRRYISRRQRSRIEAKVFLGCIMLYILSFTFIEQLDGNRLVDRGLLILLVLVEVRGTFLLYLTYNEYDCPYINQVKGLVKALVTFSFLASAYALLALVYGNVDIVMSNLPTILCVGLSLPASLYYLRNTKLGNTAKLLFWFFGVIYLYSFLSDILQFSGENGFSNNVFLYGHNIGYSFVILTPLALFAYKDNKWIGVILVILLTLLVILSAKRGAILVQGIAVLLFTFKGPYSFGRKNTALMAIVVFFALFLILTSMLELEVSPFSRFNQTGGSGRDVIYANIYNGILDSSYGQLIYGHGFYATMDFNRMLSSNHIAQQAHNDWLEVTYDFGLIGLIGYLLVFVGLCKVTTHSDKPFSRLLMILIAIFIIKSFISMVFADKGSLIYYTTIGLIILENIKEIRDDPSTLQKSKKR